MNRRRGASSTSIVGVQVHGRPSGIGLDAAGKTAKPPTQALSQTHKTAKTRQPETPQENGELERRQPRRHPHPTNKLTDINLDSEPCLWGSIRRENRRTWEPIWGFPALKRGRHGGSIL